MSSVDFSSPCAVLALLRQAHFDLITGKHVAMVGYDGKQVSYTKAELPALEKAIAKYEAQCALISGKVKRFAIRAGGN